jgi:hypothetical protein
MDEADDDWDNSAANDLTRAAWMCLTGTKECPTAEPTKEYIESCRNKTFRNLKRLISGKE